MAALPSSVRQPRVTVIGPTNVDLFIRGTAPTELDRLRTWVGPADVTVTPAGSIGYTVQVMARLGLAVEVCTTIGDDPFGHLLEGMLREAGLGTTYVERVHGETAIALYLLLFGDPKRPMTYRLPTFGAWPDPPSILDGRTPPPDLVHSGGLLHFRDRYRGGLAAVFAEARRRGIRTAIDPQFPLVDEEPPWLRFCDDVLSESDILLCDEHEAKSLFAVTDVPRAIEAAHRAGPSVVVIKRGAAGSIVSDGRTVVEQPAVVVPPERIVETVGAGDAYDAGFLDAILRGETVASAARWATATAARSLEGRGGAEAVVDRDVVTALLPAVPDPRRWGEGVVADAG